MSDAMAGLSLDDATVSAQLVADAADVAAPADAWLARRGLSFGASDIAALMVAFNLAPLGAKVPDYIADRARLKCVAVDRGAPSERKVTAPRIILEKAGLVAPLKVGSAALKGTARERELLTHWRMLLERGIYYDESAEGLVSPDSIRHADTLLRSCWPLIDRHAPMLSATLDGWATDQLGGSLVVELKCSASHREDLPWHWLWQVVAQLAVSGADYGLLVMGENWSAWHGQDGPVRAWMVERDEKQIEAVREVARRGWALVQEARGR